MKRFLASLSVLAILATGAFAQSNDSYGTQSNTNSASGTNTTNNSADPSATNNTSNDMNTTTTTDDTDNNDLPATASPLPLLALSGLGMLGSGAWLLRRRRQS